MTAVPSTTSRGYEPRSTHATATTYETSADDQAEPDVGADDRPALVGVGSDHVAQHDPAQLQVGDEPDDPEQRDDERELAPLRLA